MNIKLFVACLALAAAASAQEDFTIAVPPPPAEAGNVMWVGGAPGSVFRFEAALSGPAMRFEGEPVKNAPYSAEAVTESVQTLSDGNRIRRENRSLIYRDSQGRTRREESLNAIGPWATDAPRKTIFINDPVAGTHYVLNPDDKTGQQLPVPRLADHIELAVASPDGGPKGANRMIMRTQTGPGPGIRGAISTAALSVPGETKEEELGSRSIEGVTALGTRMTTTLAAEQVGSDRDIVITFERWHSPELNVDVLTKRNDPRVGETTYRLTNINRTEPLPSLFEPPADFDVVTETGTVENVFINRKLSAPDRD